MLGAEEKLKLLEAHGITVLGDSKEDVTKYVCTDFAITEVVI